MFGRGNWAILGIEPETHAAFASSLENLETMISVSQLAASAVTRHLERDSNGINPYGAPRLDEGEEALSIMGDSGAQLASYVTSDRETRKALPLPPSILYSPGYGFSREFRLHPTVPLYGLWFVVNEWTDVSDLASLKEQAAYTDYSRPYKFMQSGPKKELDQAVRAKTAAKRKQFPVLIDFESGRVYIENANKNVLFLVRCLLEDLGIGFVSVGWTFGKDGNWPTLALKALVEDSHYQAHFLKAAEDAARFDDDQREEIEDPEVRSIIRDYFAMTELESGLWAGLAPAAKILLHKTTAAIVVQTPITATTLLGVTQEAFVGAASVTFQERNTSVNRRTGVERIFRKDLLSFDLNDEMNLTEMGAALLRGFDLPSFRKNIQREIKKSKQVPSIQTFWLNWLIEMASSVRSIEAELRGLLELKDVESGIRPMYSSSNDDVLEEDSNRASYLLESDGRFSGLKKMITDGTLTVTPALNS